MAQPPANAGLIYTYSSFPPLFAQAQILCFSLGKRCVLCVLPCTGAKGLCCDRLGGSLSSFRRTPVTSDGARIYSNLLRRESVLGLQNAAVSGSSARSVAQTSNLLLNLCTRLPEKPKVSMVLFTVLIIGA